MAYHRVTWRALQHMAAWVVVHGSPGRLGHVTAHRLAHNTTWKSQVSSSGKLSTRIFEVQRAMGGSVSRYLSCIAPCYEPSVLCSTCRAYIIFPAFYINRRKNTLKVSSRKEKEACVSWPYPLHRPRLFPPALCQPTLQCSLPRNQ